MADLVAIDLGAKLIGDPTRARLVTP